MRIAFALDDGETFPVTLHDSHAAADLVAQLPLTLTMRDFHGIEKVADLPERLATAGAPAGATPSVGDLTYYAPWGNLAFFYRAFDYAEGLVALGRIDGDPAVLEGIGEGQAATVSLVG